MFSSLTFVLGTHSSQVVYEEQAERRNKHWHTKMLTVGAKHDATADNKWTVAYLKNPLYMKKQYFDETNTFCHIKKE